MAREADRMMSTWQDGEELDLHREMMQTTLAIATRTLFGIDLGPKMPVVAQAMDDFIRQNVGLSVWRVFFKAPTPSRKRFLRGVAALDEIVYGIIRERRASGMGEDLLSDLLRAQDTDGSAMTDKQLRDEVMTMLLAGHETTALALSWAWFLLASHPEAQAKLHDELDRVLGGRLPSCGGCSSACLHEPGHSRIPATLSSSLGDEPQGCRGREHGDTSYPLIRT